jgi:hypothetical protein
VADPMTSSAKPHREAARFSDGFANVLSILQYCHAKEEKNLARRLGNWRWRALV